MGEQAQTHDLGSALRAVLAEQGTAERIRHSQREGRGATAESMDRPGPLEFDESGFPLRQDRPSFVRRVARLLTL